MLLGEEDVLSVGDRVSLANVSLGRHFDRPLQLTITKKSLAKVTKKK